MPRGKQTWQARGEYLADCCGLTTAQFAAGIDSAMAGNRVNIAAAKPTTGHRTGAGTRTKRRARATAQAAGADQ